MTALACIGVSPHAQAAEQLYAPRAPENAPVVAGPTASGLSLVAFDRNRKICGLVREGDRDVGDFAYCERPRNQLREPFLQAEFDGRDRRTWHWGVVESEVASVEYVFRRGVRVAAPTEPGSAYAGRYAGAVRFFILEARGHAGQQPLYVRLLGADGSLLGVAEEAFSVPMWIGPAFDLIDGRTGRVRWRLRAHRERHFAPLPGDEERFSTQTCISLVSPAENAQPETCWSPDYARPGEVSLGADVRCAPLSTGVVGIVPADARRVVAVLGSGRREGLTLRALPSRLGPGKAFVLAVRRNVAIRRLTVLGVGRKMLDNYRLGLGPGAVQCGAGSSRVYLGFVDEPRDARPDADGPTLLIRDQGVRVCLAIDRFDPKWRDCGSPPLRTWQSRVVSQSSPTGSLVAGIVPAEVAAVEIELDGGETRRVEADDVGYAGRYRGLVRFFALSLPGERLAFRVRLLDEDGRRLHTYPGPDPRPLLAPFRTLARAPGGFRLGVALGRPYGTAPVLCMELARDVYPEDSEGCGSLRGLVELQAVCRPRQLLLYGLLGGRRRVSAMTDRGVIRARTRRVPRKFSPRKSTAFLLRLPPRARARAVVVGGRPGPRRRLRLPSAAAQCGWSDYLFLDRR